MQKKLSQASVALLSFGTLMAFLVLATLPTKTVDASFEQPYPHSVLYEVQCLDFSDILTFQKLTFGPYLTYREAYTNKLWLEEDLAYIPVICKVIAFDSLNDRPLFTWGGTGTFHDKLQPTPKP